MATPIKERGIRWVEAYGDKSSVLKEEMEKQIGIGSYFRWEGHDVTTDTDYYVVVCPGYSKKKGYFFFAGLRKIPAEHGASGKKFTTQADALNYAMETWNVPRPHQRPSKPFNIGDIRNKPIVLDSSPSKSAFFVGKKVIVSSIQKEAMATLTSGSTTTEPKPFFGERTYPEMLCWAYRASPFMGLLSALNTRKHFVVTDALNVARGDKVQNKFTDEEEADAPLAPTVAMCRSPHPSEYARRTNSGIEDNPLYSIKKSSRTNKMRYKPIQPMLNEDTNEYTLHRWNNIRVYPKIELPKHVLNNPETRKKWETIWGDLVQKGSQYNRPPEDYKNLNREYKGRLVPGIEQVATPQSDDESDESNDIIYFSMDPRIYNDFKKSIDTILSHATQGSYDDAKVTFPFQIQKNLVDLISYYPENEFINKHWNTPCYEQVTVGGSQLLQYDSLGIPQNMRMGSTGSRMKASLKSEEIKDEKLPEVSKEYEKREATYEFRSISDLIAKNSNPLTIYLGMKLAEAEGGNKEASDECANIILALENSRKDTTEENQAYLNYVLSKVNEYSLNQDVSNWGTVSGEDTEYYTKIQQAIEEFQELEQEIINSHGELQDKKERKTSKKYRDVQDKFKTLYKKLTPILKGFQIMSAYKHIEINPEDLADSRDCNHVLFNPLSGNYDVDDTGLPLDSKNRIADGKEGRGKGFILKKSGFAPKTIGRAKLEKRKDGSEAYAATSYDPSLEWIDKKGRKRIGKLIYDEIPENTAPSQDITGLSVMIENPTMKVPDGKGGLRDIKKSMMYPKNTKSEGQYIPGETCRISIGPKEEGARKTKRKNKKAGLVNQTFSAWRTEALAEKITEVDKDGDIHVYYVKREKKSNPLFKADPKGNYKEIYTRINKDTNEPEDLSMHFKKAADGSIQSTDTGALIAIVSKVAGLSREEIGPFTPLSSRDIRLIDEKSLDAIGYYEAITAYSQGEQTDKFGAENQLYKTGEEFVKAGVDNEKLKYGMICSNCVDEKTNKISQNIIKEMENAINDPVTAMKPKEVKLFSIVQKDKAATEFETLLDANGKHYLFGSEQAARYFLKGEEFYKQSNAKDFDVISEDLESGLELVRKSAKGDESNITYNSHIMLNKIQSYKEGKTREQIEKPREDKYIGKYAPLNERVPKVKDESEETVKPTVEEQQKPDMPQTKEEGVPEVRHPNQSVENDPVPVIQPIPPAEQPTAHDEPVSTVPVAPLAPPVPITPATQPIVAPPSGRQRKQHPPPPAASPRDQAVAIYNANKAMKHLPQDILDQKLISYGPEVGRELKKYIEEQRSKMPALSSSTLQKLVALANKYEDDGRYKEADVIDNMIFSIAERIKE